MKWVNNLKWDGKDDWDTASRRGFSVGTYFEGNVKESGNLAVYWVDRAGHMVCIRVKMFCFEKSISIIKTRLQSI